MYRAWPEEVETEDWPAEGAWPERKELEEGVWLGERTGSSQMLLETEGLVWGQRLVVEDLPKVVWLRERGELEKEGQLDLEGRRIWAPRLLPLG